MRIATRPSGPASGLGLPHKPLGRAAVKPAPAGIEAPSPIITTSSSTQPRPPASDLLLQAVDNATPTDTSTRRALFLQAGAALAALALLPSLPSTASALPPSSTILVVGATGRTGRLAVAALASRGYTVRAAVRDPAKADALGVAADAKGGVVKLDLAAPEAELATALGAALAGVDAVVCAAGFNGGGGGSSYATVDEAGTVALINAAASSPAVKRFVLLTSILTNGAAKGQGWNPAFIILKKALTAKLAAEQTLRSSGLDWVIVRPGGLADKPPSEVGAPILRGEDELLGLPGDPGRAVSRETVADLLASAVAVPAAGGRVLELVASTKVEAVAMDELVAGLAA